MTDALVQRLEAVASRLEKAVDHLGSGAGASSSASSSSSGAMGGSNMTSPGLIAWRRFISTEVAAFVTACGHFPELKKLAEWISTITSTLERLIAASLHSKKPTAAELSAFLADLTAVSGEVSKAQDNRSPFGSQLKAFEESLSGFMWVTVSPPEALPKELAQGGLEAADFYLTRVLTEAKKLTGADATNRAAFATTFKALLTQQVAIVREHFATGLSWNPKGGALSAAPASSGAPTAATAAAASSSSSAPAAGAAVGRGALFSQLSSMDVTAGLKKVTADMKTKNLKDVPALEPKKPAAAPAAAVAPKAVEAPKEPKVYNSKGTWFVENYTGGVVVVDQVELKENVYILKCKNTQVSVPVKCKSIQVDSCTKTDVQFKNVVSIFEIFNSQRINIYCDEHVPSVAVDKCNGVGVHLTRQSVATPPQLITSSISEMNLIVPGKTDEDDPIEIPLPEQYLTVYKDGKLVTECVAHSAN